jgi:cytochrome c553
MKYRLLILGAGLAVIGAGCSNLDRSRDLANPDVSPAVTAVQVCSMCHGLDGNSESPEFPRLAAQQSAYLINQLTNFRSRQRADPSGAAHMWGPSHHLTDAQIAGLAEYYSAKIAHRVAAPAADPALLARGKEIFNLGPGSGVPPCAACHGPKGLGMGAFPRLAYQHADYIMKQLDAFEKPQARPDTPMDSVTHPPLTSENKGAIASYLQAFPD